MVPAATVGRGAQNAAHKQPHSCEPLLMVKADLPALARQCSMQLYALSPSTRACLHASKAACSHGMFVDHGADACLNPRCHGPQRDLKPQNLLLSDNTRQPVLKIADFGFARNLQPQVETMSAQPSLHTPAHQHCSAPLQPQHTPTISFPHGTPTQCMSPCLCL